MRQIAIFVLAAALAGCAAQPPAAVSAATAGSAPPATPGDTAAPAVALDRIFDDYYEYQLEWDPLLATSIGDDRYDDRLPDELSAASRAGHAQREQEFLARLEAIDPATLDDVRRTSWEIFRYARRRELENLRFPEHLLPIDQFQSMAITFAQLGSGVGTHPFRTAKDYDHFLERVNAFDRWVDLAIANMREGVRLGVVQPKVLMERTVPQLDSQIVDAPEKSLFYGPIRNFPGEVSEADRARLTAAYRQAITTQIVPAYRRLREFIASEYLPKTRDTFGLAALPDGQSWYASRVRAMTTLDVSPERVHEIGLAEVARIQNEMRGVMQKVGFKGDLKAFFAFMQDDPQFVWPTREAMIDGYVDIKNRVNPALPRLFEVLPKADYEVRAVEPFRERSAAGGQYSAASADGRRPGIFYANAYDLRARPKWAMEALSLHEANPGHHFQITVQREAGELPRFRRFGGRYTAFSEGWALYAESLGPELGMYEDPYQYFGMLDGELFRAIRLVVDTGLHSKSWTREQAIAYIEQNSATAEAKRVSETERYIAMPAQALAYKMGQLKIRELRTRAERALGDRFDVRRFHTQVIGSGAMPLDVLEARIDRWIASQR